MVSTTTTGSVILALVDFSRYEPPPKLWRHAL